MNSVGTNYGFILAAVLFVIGILGVLLRRNLIYVLLSIEILLNAAAVAFVSAAAKWKQPDGQSAVIFILVVAAAETAVGLSLILRIFHNWKNIDSDEVSEMKG